MLLRIHHAGINIFLENSSVIIFEYCLFLTLHILSS